MEERIKQALHCKEIKSTGRGGGGCINKGEAYDTDQGLVFVKRNAKPGARLMFDGEYEGLKAILLTETVRTPKPLVVLDDGKKGAVLVMEYFEMKPLSKQAAKLGHQLAQMHLHNARLLRAQEKNSASVHRSKAEIPDDLLGVTEFGFDCPTCCGFIPQDNTWCSNWLDFFTRQKLQLQIDRILNEKGDRELHGLWSHLQLKIPQLFAGIDITPALLHGDLWSGNAAETKDEPVIFDAAAFYGHSEFDLAIAEMFGGFSPDFFKTYHEAIPKAKGFNNRLKLYQLFHYLNHWNHFGGGYRSSSISTMKSLSAS